MATYYANQAGSGSADGSSLGNAASMATLNARTNSPGDLIILNGTITSTLTVHDSGTNGSVITYQFASGAKFSKAFWGQTTSSAIYASSKNYIVIDGNSVGIVECTANGDALANQQISCGVYTTGCDHFTVQNLTIQNIFVHTFGTANPGGIAPYTTCGWDSEEGSNLDMHGCTVSNAYDAILWRSSTVGTKSSYYFYSNTVTACSTPVVIASSTSGAVINDAQVYNNDLTMGLNWYEVADANHIDGIHFWGLIGGSMTNTQAYNNYIHGDCSSHSTGFIFWEGEMGTVLVYNNLLIGGPTNHPLEGYINQAYNTSDTGKVNTGKIYNNTIVGLATDSTGGNGISIDPSLAGMVTDIQNNIIKSCNVGIYYPANVGTITSDYNVFYNLGSVADNGGFISTLASWKTTSLPQGGNPDAHSVNTDPNLNGSYVPQVVSSAINAGTNLSGSFTTDKNGNNRGSTWWIGCYQTSATIISTSIKRIGKYLRIFGPSY